MNDKYFRATAQKQIEKINEDLELMRQERDFLTERIANFGKIRELLKEGLKRNEKEN